MTLSFIVFTLLTSFIHNTLSAQIFLNASGGAFAKNVLLDSMFAYQFIFPRDAISYFPLNAAAAKCNIMGYWYSGNTDLQQPNGTIKAIDTAICTDACTQSVCGWVSNNINNRSNHFRRTPLVDFAVNGSPLSTADYLFYKDLLSLPAIAGGVVPIYNIPELTNNPSLYLILSRTSIANIFLGNIRYWNDPRILADNNNNAATKAVLATITKPIRVVVRQDSSAISTIFASALSSFNPIQPTATFAGTIFDSSFATSVGSSSSPTWCGLKTDEIQKITITNCNPSLPTQSKLITMIIVNSNYNIKNITFLCDAHANSFRSLFMTSNGGKSVFVSMTQSGSPSYINVFTIGYQASVGGPKNWYQPSITSISTGLSATISTLQEGGYVNNQFVTIPILPEIKSLWISKSATFDATLNYVLLTCNITATNGQISGLSTCPMSVSKIWITISAPIDHPFWKEYQITFSIISKSFIAQPMSIKITTPGLGLVAFVNTLTTANNYPVFYDTIHKYGLSGSGQYTCYKREHNYTAWSFNTGYNDGIPAEVNICYLSIYVELRILRVHIIYILNIIYS